MNPGTGETVELLENIAEICQRWADGLFVYNFEIVMVNDFIAGLNRASFPPSLSPNPCEVCTLITKAAAADNSYEALQYAKAARTLAETISIMEETFNG
jgi:hypothetical protein